MLTLGLLPVLSEAVLRFGIAPSHLAAFAHLAFSVIVALIVLPVLGPWARLLEQLLPDRAAETDPAAPRYLDPAALGTPPVALANAKREALRQADALEEMLNSIAQAFTTADRALGERIEQLNRVIDALNRAIQSYLTSLPEELLGEEERRRARAIAIFALNLESASDVLERSWPVSPAAGCARAWLCHRP